MHERSVFIAATGQNVGKTTLCLGIISELIKRFPKVGFIKPVGQQHERIDANTIVDKDALLFKKHFNLTTPWAEMSPVIIPAGFTRDFLDERMTEEPFLEKIKTSFKNISKNNDYTIVEGTGHVGVGSIIGLNNAKVAKELDLEMVIIASGGLGSAHDELALNIAMCKEYGVRVRGVILNRVLEEKKEMIESYVPRALKKWNIPLIGCVPFNELLSNPTVRDYEALFETTLISGHGHHYRHFSHFRLVAGSLKSYEEQIIDDELVITPATREDIIATILQRDGFKGGLILTGSHAPAPALLEKIRKTDIPTLYAPLCSFDAMKTITSFTAKIRPKDLEKIEKAINLVSRHINFETLLHQKSPIV